MGTHFADSTAVLYVDADEHRAKVMLRRLGSAGCSVQQAATGADALRLLSETLDVVLLRIRLPDMPGWQVAGHIKANPLTACIPVICLSDTTSQSQVQEQDLRGVDAHLLDPVNTEHLLTVMEALRRYRHSTSQSEKRFRAVLGGSGIRMGCQDRQGRYTWIFNPGPGLDPRDVLGKTDADLVSPEGAAKLGSLRQEVLATGQPIRREVALDFPGGQRVFDLSVEPDAGPDEVIRGICVAAVDITDRISSERALVAALQSAERTADQLTRLQAATAALSGALTPQAVVQTILAQAMKALGAKAGLVSLLTTDGLQLEPVGAFGYPPGYVEASRQTPINGDGITLEVVRTGQPVWLESREAVAARYPTAAAHRAAGLEALAILPLRQEASNLGVLVLSFATPQNFHRDDQALLLTMAELCAQALERSRLYAMEQLARRAAEQTAKRLAQLQAVTEAFSQALTAEQVCAVILQQGVGSFDASGGMVYVLAPEGTDLVCLGHIGYGTGVQDYHRLPLAADLPAPEVVRTAQLLWFNSYTDFTERYPQLMRPRLSNSEAVLLLPLILDGRTFGALVFNFPTPRPLQPDDKAFALTLARYCAQALGRASVFADLDLRIQERTAALRREVDRRIEVQRQLEQAREVERGRIARELHDELGGALTALRMDLKRLERLHPDTAPSVIADVRQMSADVGGTIDLVRRIATELRPALLDSFGLVAALEHYFQDFTRRSGLDGAFEGDEVELPLSSQRAVACFRIFQEALTNVARHAHATHVRVRIESQDGRAIVRIVDNGRGFDLAAGAKTGHLGLLGMRERAALASASLQISAEPGNGTTVVLSIPLDQPDLPQA